MTFTETRTGDAVTIRDADLRVAMERRGQRDELPACSYLILVNGISMPFEVDEDTYLKAAKMLDRDLSRRPQTLEQRAK